MFRIIDNLTFIDGDPGQICRGPCLFCERNPGPAAPARLPVVYCISAELQGFPAPAMGADRKIWL